MHRRQFLASSLASSAAIGAAASIASGQEGAAELKKPESPTHRFKLKYAPHFGMFADLAGNDPIDQLKFAADQGFTAWEDNGMMRNSPEQQQKLGDAMEKLGIEMGVFVSYSGFGKDAMMTNTSADFQESLRKHMREAVECAKRVRAKWTTVVPGNISLRVPKDYQMANCVANLKVMAEVCEPAELVMVLEPLNWWANHPGLFLSEIPQAYLICQAVGSPSCKILDDLYHQQISEGNLIPNMAKAWSEIAYIQVGDNPGRQEPTTGEINFKNIFRWLYRRGYKGIVGMEHGVSRPGKEGEQALIDAYVEVDSFDT
jgi:hydroxypyruvate isomerase